MNVRRILKCVSSRKNFRASLLQNVKVCRHTRRFHIWYIGSRTGTESLAEPLFTNKHTWRHASVLFEVTFLSGHASRHQQKCHFAALCAHTPAHARQSLQVPVWLFHMHGAVFVPLPPEAGPPESRVQESTSKCESVSTYPPVLGRGEISRSYLSDDGCSWCVRCSRPVQESEWRKVDP